jgi:preprotein translocase subunit SecY
MLTMENLTRYLGLVIILIGAIVVIVAMAMGEPSNTMLGTGAILAVVGLLVQIFIGRSSD